VARNTIFQHIGDGVVVLNMQNLVVDLNPAAEHLSGYASSEALGLPVEQIWTNWPTQAVLSEPASTVIEGCVLICAAQERTFDLHIHTIDDDKNHPLNKVVLLIDISGRKQAEEEKAKLEEQLLQAQKLETVGRLAGGVAHDFNNMLQVISGYAEMSLGMVDAKQPLHKYRLEIRRSAQRSAEITQQLLAFARKQTVSPKVLDLNDAVARSRKMLQRLVGEDIDLAWMPGSDLWKVMIDPSQLDQVLANLAVNARDAIGGVGKVTVETENVSFDEAYCADHAGFVVGEYLLLALSDDGQGMDKETQSHIFEPFFTTKDPGKGTGLGLATVYGIVKQNNGFINVYSEPGHGSTFRIYFPRAEAAEKVEGEEVEEVTQRGGAETVLVVEDDGAILELAREMLGQLGYTVLCAPSPEEALRVSAEHAGRIHLLLTDVVMPRMNGRQVAERLQAARSDLKCLYMSGYTADVIAHRGVLEEGVSFIAKPFSLPTLAGKVRAVLDTPEGK
jgi:PAS domain S-box-containing protein